ncbi:hypothetical protein AB1N83_013383 [Pleurotus pulmonarius]
MARMRLGNHDSMHGDFGAGNWTAVSVRAPKETKNCEAGGGAAMGQRRTRSAKHCRYWVPSTEHEETLGSYMPEPDAYKQLERMFFHPCIPSSVLLGCFPTEMHDMYCATSYSLQTVGTIRILLKHICVVSRVQYQVLLRGDHAFRLQQLKHPLPPDKGPPSGHTASSGRHTAKQNSRGSGGGTGGTMQHRAQSPPSVGGTRICPSLQTWSLGKHAFRQAIGGGSGSASVADAATSTTAAKIVLENIVVLVVVWDIRRHQLWVLTCF